MLWIAWISQHPHNLSSKSKHGPSQICNLSELENRLWWPFLCPYTNVNPFLTIHYTYNDTLEGLRCCEMAESVSTGSILVWNVGAMHQTFHHPWLKSQGVVTVVENEFQSEPSPTIHYTYNDTLEGLGCCELPETVSTHTIWVRKVS